MNPLEVFMRYVGFINRQLLVENQLRTQCFYMVAPYWDSKKNGPLKWLWQLWEIPDIDHKQLQSVPKQKYTTIRYINEEEKKLVEKLNAKRVRNRR